jgi:hypothetical protein
VEGKPAQLGQIALGIGQERRPLRVEERGDAVVKFNVPLGPVALLLPFDRLDFLGRTRLPLSLFGLLLAPPFVEVALVERVPALEIGEHLASLLAGRGRALGATVHDEVSCGAAEPSSASGTPSAALNGPLERDGRPLVAFEYPITLDVASIRRDEIQARPSRCTQWGLIVAGARLAHKRSAKAKGRAVASHRVAATP